MTTITAPSLWFDDQPLGASLTMARPDLDEALTLVASGDRAAFSIVYDETAPIVYGIALRVLRSPAHAEEVAQEVYLQVWRKATTFDPVRGSGKAWIATIAHRRAVDAVRRVDSARRREKKAPIEPDVVDVAERAIEADEHRRVRTALSALPDHQREAISLAYFGAMTYAQVAAHLDTPVGTVKTRIRDGMRRLRSALEDPVV